MPPSGPFDGSPPPTLSRRRTRIGRGETNRSIEIIAHSVIELLHAVQFRLEIGSRAWADMARDTLDLRVRGVLGCDKLRFHRKMTSSSAELNRFCNLVGLITPKGRQKQESNACRNKECEKSSVARS